MNRPFILEQDATVIRVAGEVNADQIERFALVPFDSAPQIANGWNVCDVTLFVRKIAANRDLATRLHLLQVQRHAQAVLHVRTAQATRVIETRRENPFAQGPVIFRCDIEFNLVQFGFDSSLQILPDPSDRFWLEVRDFKTC